MEGLQTFFVAKGNSELKNESLRDDLTPYDYFEGDDMNTFADEFSDATGSMRRARRRLKRGRTHTKEGKAKGNMFQRLETEDKNVERQRLKENKILYKILKELKFKTKK